jgi:hypothetical protein
MDTAMAFSPLQTSLGIALTLFNLGCRQEIPKAPPSSPIPTTRTPAASVPPPAVVAGGSPTSARSGATSSAAAPPIGSRTGGSAQDAIITGRVKAEVLKASDGKSIDINVDTQNGVVRLTGFAPSNSDIDRAVEIAKRVEGVKDVQHTLTVKPG